MGKMLALAMSGGVDSGMSAVLLRPDWPRMAGVSHYIWPDSTCCSTDVLSHAREICETIGIPYFVLDLTADFKRHVVDDFIDVYAAGMTPNPCVRCNQLVRFGSFYRNLKTYLSGKELMSDDDELYFATGHYVRVEKTQDGFLLRKAVDLSKDQSYMLYRIDPAVLPNCIFPLGGLYKRNVVRMASESNLPGFCAKESQDACFIRGRYADFLLGYLDREKVGRKGPIRDINGEYIGEHRGYIHYTVGQRKGLGLGSGPWFVERIIPETNTVIVGRRNEVLRKRIRIRDLHWHARPETEDRLLVRVRYNSRELPCEYLRIEGDTAVIGLKDETVLTPGQSAVIYRDDYVVGGGFIILPDGLKD